MLLGWQGNRKTGFPCLLCMWWNVVQIIQIWSKNVVKRGVKRSTWKICFYKIKSYVLRKDLLSVSSGYFTQSFKSYTAMTSTGCMSSVFCVLRWMSETYDRRKSFDFVCICSTAQTVSRMDGWACCCVRALIITRDQLRQSYISLIITCLKKMCTTEVQNSPCVCTVPLPSLHPLPLCPVRGHWEARARQEL